METKSDFEKKMDAQMAAFNEKMDDLKTKAEQASADARAAYETRMKEYREKQKAIQEKLDELKRQGDESWETLRAGIESAADDLDRSLREAMAYFK